MKKLILVTLLFLSLSLLFSETVIPAGEVWGEWTLEGSPYLIEGELSIPNSESLTISPGVIIEFQGHHKFNVQGQLISVGTLQDSIYFTINDTIGFSNPTTTDGGWHGIRFDETSAQNDSSRIAYSIIEYGKAIRFGDNWYDDHGGAIFLKNFSKLEIINSKIHYNFAEDEGGGISTYNSSFKINNSIIENNRSTNNGGGIKVTSGSPNISNNLVRFNFSYRGGGVYCGGNSTAEFYYNDITHNISSGEAAGFWLNSLNPGVVLSNNNISFNTCLGNHGGGGLSIARAAILINNTISHNIANTEDSFSKGGGIHFLGSSTAYLENNIIEFNQANKGGGLSFSDASESNPSYPILVNNKINNNTATSDGGGLLYIHEGKPTFINNIFSSNTAGNCGGGAYISCTASLQGNLITYNTADEGGGLYFRSYSEPDTSYVINNTICYNSSLSSGGGITFKGSNKAIFYNTIIYNNSSLIGDQVFLHWYYIYIDEDVYPCWPLPEFSYCNIESGLEGFEELNDPNNSYFYNNYLYTDNIDSIPEFSDITTFNFTLQDNSPCINSGTPDVTGLNLPEFDLAGNPRIYDDRIDMGCYEWQGVVSTDEDDIPQIVILSNYPNPFNPSTTISFNLPMDQKAELTIFNIKGQRVRKFTELKNQNSVVWKGKDESGNSVSSGIYFYRLETKNTTLQKKMILLK